MGRDQEVTETSRFGSLFSPGRLGHVVSDDALVAVSFHSTVPLLISWSNRVPVEKPAYRAPACERPLGRKVEGVSTSRCGSSEGTPPRDEPKLSRKEKGKPSQ